MKKQQQTNNKSKKNTIFTLKIIED